MLVKMTVAQEGDILEEYIVPNGSWVQTRHLGAQYAWPSLEPMVIPYNVKGDTVTLTIMPISPPKVPEKLLKLVASGDPKWGKNGWTWLGCERHCHGGMPFDRIRHYASQCRSGWFEGPTETGIVLTDAEIEALLSN